MSTSIFKFNKCILSATISAALVVPAAQALEITAAVSYALNGSAPITNINGPQSSGSVDILNSAYDSNGNDIFYHVYGNETGNFGSRVSGNGTYDITGTFTYTDTIMNSSTTDQSYNFTFDIIPGEIGVFGTPTGADFLLAEYDINILVNNASIWDSAAVIDTRAANTFTQSGTSLNSSFPSSSNDTYFQWNDFSDTLDLGILGAGDSLNLEYTLTSHAAGSISATNCFNANIEIIEAIEVIGDGGAFGSCGNSIARSGDPLFFGSTPNTSSISSSPVTSVPEPSSLLLLGLGLAGLASARRSKKN